MASKGAKETFANKLGFKSNSSKAIEAEFEKLKKENAHLKKTLDEMSKRNGRHHVAHSDSDNAKLLERILALETLRERNVQQLLDKEQEIATMRQQLQAQGGEVVALQKQLDQQRQETEKRETLFQKLSKEAEDLKNRLVVITEKCKASEKLDTDMQVPSGELVIVQDQLRDALEKNQQWLIYDKQRESFVQGILARTAELEQQLNQAKESLQQQYEKADSEGQSAASIQQEKQLPESQKEVEEERKRTSHLQVELDELKARYELKSSEVVRAREELQEECRTGRKTLAEERKLNSERVCRLQCEIEAANVRLEEERKRAAELLQQVNFLQKSLLIQQEDKKKMAILEQQVQMSTRDSENELLLHKVLKELRKARDQIARLEAAKQQRETRFSEPSSYNRRDMDKQFLKPTSPVKKSDILDESFLECPNCQASYPTSQHRELLVHLDYCFS